MSYCETPASAYGSDHDDVFPPAVKSGPSRSINIKPASTKPGQKIGRSYVAQTEYYLPPTAMTEHAPLPPDSYPHSLEQLYIQMGIIRSEALDCLPLWEANNQIWLWVDANPVAAMHVMGLARKLGLRPTNIDLAKLDDKSTSYKFKNPCIRQKTFEKVDEMTDMYIDKKMAKIGRSGSKHTSQQQAARRKIRHDVRVATRQELFKTSNLDAPRDIKGHHGPLPLAALQLYADFTGQELPTLPADERDTMLHAWAHCWPVSDFHLENEMQNWYTDITPVDLGPGVKRLMNDIGAVETVGRLRSFSDVSIKTIKERLMPGRW